MRRPDFYVIGAARCGTTSLYHYLRAHPGIFMPDEKEPRYFALDAFPGSPYYDEMRTRWVSEEADYLALFAEAREDQRIGEATPIYLYHPEAPSRILAASPEARFIAILRNPIDRAHSHYMLRAMRGRTDVTFEDAVREEMRLGDAIWGGEQHFLRLGRYGEALDRWLEVVPRERMLLLLHDDLRTDADGVVRRVYDFLGVDPSVRPPVETRYSMTGLPKNALVRRVFRSRGLKKTVRALLPRRIVGSLGEKVRTKAFERPTVSPALRAELADYYRDDIARASEIVGRDLSHWTSPPEASGAPAAARG